MRKFILLFAFTTSVILGSCAQREPVVTLSTEFGEITIILFEETPEHKKNFLELAQGGFYDGTTFHRVIDNFMIQGGDPNSKKADRSMHGMGGPGYSINAEFNNTRHDRGVVSMARSQDPNSAGSQFFIVVKDAHFLDHKYTAFGRVTKGMEVADKIVRAQRDGNDNPLEPISMKIIIKTKK